MHILACDAADIHATRKAPLKIGLISDTHGQLRPEVLDVLEGVEWILHAGDVGGPDILLELEAVAPVVAVWGNTDGFDVRESVPEVASIQLAGRDVVVMHGHQVGSPTPELLRRAHPEADIIVYGHTHRPMVDRDRSLVVNPGAAGPARFALRPSVAILELAAELEDVQLIELGGQE